ncbi:MAG: DUF2589 domain-containing protein, partial [Treponema sp.]|nr:DUF2589 domain-containing protein [Treponema sp.]
MSIPGRRKGIHGNGRGDGITLSDIIRGLQHCVNSSQEIVEQHHIRGLDRFFDADGRPYSTTVRINDSAFMDIPHLCMSGHSSLILDELEVKLELMLRKTALKSNVDEIYGPNAPDQNTVPETGQSRKGRREEG